jgi:lysophospholipase L1-like esterase
VHRFAWKRTLVGFLVLTAAIAVPATASAKSSKQSSKSKVGYVALGDSLAFGYQQAKYNALLPSEPPTAYKTGYVDVFSKLLAKAKKSKVRTTNLGCPGETTDSLLGLAPCPYHPPFRLHVNYPGSQMAAAVAALSRKRKPAAITIDIGANDALATINKCNADPTPYPDAGVCILAKAPATYDHIAANLTTILTNIRAVAPRTPLIMIGLYNPLTAQLGTSSDVLAKQLNARLASVSAAFGAKFVDPLSVFNPPGDTEIPTLCSLTAVCGPLKDIHPTDAGYRALGKLAFATAAIRKKR